MIDIDREKMVTLIQATQALSVSASFVNDASLVALWRARRTSRDMPDWR